MGRMGLGLVEGLSAGRHRTGAAGLGQEAMPFYKLGIEIEKSSTSGGDLDGPCMALARLDCRRRPATSGSTARAAGA